MGRYWTRRRKVGIGLTGACLVASLACLHRDGGTTIGPRQAQAAEPEPRAQTDEAVTHNHEVFNPAVFIGTRLTEADYLAPRAP